MYFTRPSAPRVRMVLAFLGCEFNSYKYRALKNAADAPVPAWKAAEYLPVAYNNFISVNPRIRSFTPYKAYQNLEM